MTTTETKQKKQMIPQATRFFLVMYEEPTLELIGSFGVKEYAYIRHDFDEWTQEDENENAEHKAGTLKKTHWHLYISTRTRRTINAVRKHFNNALAKFAESEFGCVRYLTHIDYPEKYQYEIMAIKSNMDVTSIFQMQISDSQFVMDCIEKITMGEIYTFRDLTFYAIQSGKIDLIIKRSYFFNTLLKERG